MPTETGNTQNLASFESLISYAISYGTTYNPTHAALKITAMQTQLTAAKAALDDCAKKQTAYDNAVDARRDGFAKLKPLSTKITNALSVSGVTDSIIEGAKTINRKIQGKRAIAIAEKTNTTTATANLPTMPKNISSSQQGFDNQIEHLNNLIELAASHVEYNPNEPELKLTALKSYLNQLKTLNTNVINAETAWSNTRLTRDKLLYAQNTGLVDTGINAKNYIKSVFGATSPQYAQVKSLQFKNR